MKQKSFTHALVAASAVAAALYGTSAHAQSSDALLNKLVDKGILTTDEAKSLKAETDQGFAKAFQAKSGMPDWVTSLKFNGDLRGRYESIYFDNDAALDRHRFRYRLRLGAVATFKDNLELGVRLTSGEPVSGFTTQTGSPLSGNSTFQDNGSKKFAYIDLAYGKWTPIRNDEWMLGATLGKMENPFVFSDNVMDRDYTPEGAALQGSFAFNKDHTLRLNAGIFALDELAGDSNDPYMSGVQIRWDGTWSKAIKTSLGAGVLSINNAALLTSGNVPDVNRGNTRTLVATGAGTPAASSPLYHFNPFVGDASITYTLDSFPGYAGAFPIRLGGEFLHNPAAPAKNNSCDAGVTFGKAGRKGQWELTYRYRYVEADSWYEEMTDDDFGAFYQTSSTRAAAGYSGGTNTRGHWVKASYSPYDAIVLSMTYYGTELIALNPGDSNSGVNRFQMDVMWKF